jgi:hypothetical protein
MGNVPLLTAIFGARRDGGAFSKSASNGKCGQTTEIGGGHRPPLHEGTGASMIVSGSGGG